MPRAIRCARTVTGFLGGATLVGLVLFVVDELGFRRDERRLAKTNGARTHVHTLDGGKLAAALMRNPKAKRAVAEAAAIYAKHVHEGKQHETS